MASNNKMKGLLKGLRYISEIFENEKEAEMIIGMPTNVKHVAHIGCDGPSATVTSAPTWMNEFKSANNGESPRGEDPVMQTRNIKEKSDKPKKSSKSSSKSGTKHKKKSKDPTDPKSEDARKASRRKRSKECGDGSRRSMNQDLISELERTTERN